MRGASRGFALALLTLACVQSKQSTVTSDAWTLVWRDEFNGAAGARADSMAWSYDTADGCQMGICGWGNEEKQFYTSAPENSALNGRGALAIVAHRAPTGLRCSYGPCRYTSARLTTKGKLHAQPGRVEARIKLPAGQGLWPAFWMLGSAYPGTPWPQSGEIDVMENHGSNPREISSAIHGPGYSGKTPFARGYALPAGSFADDFHRFAVEWDDAHVRFFVDDTLHYAMARADVERSGKWVFTQPFFIVLNLAVGGTFDGDPHSDAILPATMLVDYVRVYAPRGAAVVR